MLDEVLQLVTRKDADVAPPLDVDVYRVRITVYMGFASFMILIWDHIVTFADEVEYIWRGRMGFLTGLFLLNRYLTPLGFIVNLFAYLSPTWTVEVTYSSCHHYVRYEGSMTVIGINTTALMMLLRIAALYHRQPLVIAFVAVCFGFELGVNAWLLTHGVAVVHQSSVHACTMIFDDSVALDSSGWIASASAWLPLTYDTIVLALTLNKTLGPIRRKTAGNIARVLLRDGILYYSVIFAVNAVLTIMIVAAPSGLQNITAQLEYLLTVAMMSRITLHLRKQVQNRTIPTDVISLRTLSQSLPRFRSNGGGQFTTDLGDISVMVQESAVIHDDCGNPVRGYDDDDSDDSEERVERQKDRTVEQDWSDLRQPTPLMLHSKSRQDRNSPAVRFA